MFTPDDCDYKLFSGCRYAVVTYNKCSYYMISYMGYITTGLINGQSDGVN